MVADQAKQTHVSKAPNFRQIRRQAPQAIRRDHNTGWKAFATATEQAAASSDSRKLFQLVKEASGQKSPICDTLLDRDGNFITAREKLSFRWREHFLELLNHDAAPVTAEFPTDNGDSPPYDCNFDVPTVAEIEAIVRGLKDGKVASEDCLVTTFARRELRRHPWHCPHLEWQPTRGAEFGPGPLQSTPLPCSTVRCCIHRARSAAQDPPSASMPPSSVVHPSATARYGGPLR